MTTLDLIEKPLHWENFYPGEKMFTEAIPILNKIKQDIIELDRILSFIGDDISNYIKILEEKEVLDEVRRLVL